MALLAAGALAGPSLGPRGEKRTHTEAPSWGCEGTPETSGRGSDNGESDHILFDTKSGFFRAVEDQPAIRGICEKKLSKMRRSITVGGPAAESFIRIHQRLI